MTRERVTLVCLAAVLFFARTHALDYLQLADSLQHVGAPRCQLTHTDSRARRAVPRLETGPRVHIIHAHLLDYYPIDTVYFSDPAESVVASAAFTPGQKSHPFANSIRIERDTEELSI